MEKWLWLACVLLLGAGARAQQVKEYKFELGAHYSLARLTRLEETAQGAGLRADYNLNDFFALEGEANYFGRSEARWQFVGGLRAGVRNRRYGLFFKWRPGVVVFPALNGSRARFALDAGGVIELYPARRAIVRLDVGDTRVFTRRAAFPARLVQNSYSHNFQMSAGFGFRF